MVKGLHSAYVEPLNCILNASFQISWEQNNTYQLQFTAYDNKSVAYALLDAESSIYFHDQEYIVKQCISDFESQVETKQIVATHVYKEVNRIRQRNVKAGTLTYSVQDVLEFYFKDNALEFEYKVYGEFEKTQITDLGNDSGKDALDKIISAWPTAVIYPDNKVIQVYSNDAWLKDYGARIDYINNSSAIKMTYESTAIANQIMVYGKTKDSDSSDKTEYYFPPHLVSNQDSIAKWGLHPGEDLSDERFTDSNSMDQYALTQLVNEPSVSIEVTYNGTDMPKAGEQRRLEIRQSGFVTNVQVVGFVWFPLDNSQPTQLTFNNTARTILDYQNNYKELLKKSIENTKRIEAQAQSASESAKNANKQINYTWTEADVDEWYGH